MSVQENMCADENEPILAKDLDYRYWSYENDDESCIEEECPCCFPPYCSDGRKDDWYGCFKLSMFYIIIVQVILYTVTLMMSTNTGKILSPNVDILLSFGASNSEKIWGQYQLWRLFLPIVLHGHIIHIILNSLGQICFCLGLEKNWGTKRFLLVYVISGFMGCVLTSGIRTMNCGVGASGSLFGILGAYIVPLVFYFNQTHSDYTLTVFTIPVIAVLGFIGSELIVSADNVGHLGGFISGAFIFLITMDLENVEYNKTLWSIVGYVGITLMLIITLIIQYSN